MLFLTFMPSFQLLYVITTVCWRIDFQTPTINILSGVIIFLLSALHQACIRPCRRMVRMELARRKTSTLEVPSKNPMDDLNLPTRMPHPSKVTRPTPQLLPRATQIPSNGEIAIIIMLPSRNSPNPRPHHMLPNNPIMHLSLNINPFRPSMLLSNRCLQ